MVVDPPNCREKEEEYNIFICMICIAALLFCLLSVHPPCMRRRRARGHRAHIYIYYERTFEKRTHFMAGHGYMWHPCTYETFRTMAAAVVKKFHRAPLMAATSAPWYVVPTKADGDDGAGGGASAVVSAASTGCTYTPLCCCSCRPRASAAACRTCCPYSADASD